MQPPDPARFAYADPRQLLRETLDGFLPPKRISVREHAEEHRWVKSAAGVHLERWDPTVAPYLNEIMEALTSDKHDTVAVVGPGACGKTMVAENWLLQTIDADPAELLWYMQTDPITDAYVKGRIDPMLEAHDKLIGHLRNGRDSVGFKRFRGGRAEFLTATGSNFTNKHVRRIVADEIDAWDRNLGDAKPVLDPRRQAAGADSMLLMLSHPDLGAPIGAPRDRQRGIMAPYVDSDRRTWWWACPECGERSSPNPGTGHRMVLSYPEEDGVPLDEIAEQARLICPHCEVRLEDRRRREMNLTGRWLRHGEFYDEDGALTGDPVVSSIAGFWILGIMSPFTKDGIGGIARARVAAERAAKATGDWEGLRQIVVKTEGLPFERPRHLSTIDAAVLAERADRAVRLGYVPEGVRFITIWADAQANRFEYLARGWGVAGTSWVIDHKVIPAEPATSAEDWDKLLKLLAETEYPLADGSGRVMRVRGAGFDGYGQAGVTEQAYAAWLRRRNKRGIRPLGHSEGRHVWSLLPTKGADERKAARISVVYPNSQRKDRRAVARGQVPLLLFNPNGAKDALAAALAVIPPAEGCVQFPAELRSEGAEKHEFFEQLAAEERDPTKGTWAKKPGAIRNEALDLMVGTEVIARLHGYHRIDWERPAPWAAEWSLNPLVGPPTPPPEAAPVQPTAPAAPAAVVIAAGAARQPGTSNRLRGMA